MTESSVGKYTCVQLRTIFSLRLPIVLSGIMIRQQHIFIDSCIVSLSPFFHSFSLSFFLSFAPSLSLSLSMSMSGNILVNYYRSKSLMPARSMFDRIINSRRTINFLSIRVIYLPPSGVSLAGSTDIGARYVRSRSKVGTLRPPKTANYCTYSVQISPRLVCKRPQSPRLRAIR